MADDKGITTRAADFAQWYQDIVKKADLAEHAPVRGSMVIKPYGYAIWEKMRDALDVYFKETGHVNAYFPMFIPESFLKKEAEHVEGFSPELAVVTHAGGKALEEALVVRPTSETIIWHTYKNWIHSWRDLPILINQWANVVRWELRPRLFLRTTEFLWQEGHTAHATAEEAEEETLRMLEVYRRFNEEYLAIPVMCGKKTDNEKFAGAVTTYTIEAMMQDGKALQNGTSHNLGQNFAKAFDVTFSNKENKLEHVYATSWGVSTRLVGALIMAHSDDKGLVLPPKIAPHQVVVVPIANDDAARSKVNAALEPFLKELKASGVRVHVDNREQYRPGYKFNEWELKGVPVRVEIGPRDVDQGNLILARRDGGAKQTVPVASAVAVVVNELADMQKSLLDRALKFREERTYSITSFDEFSKRIDQGGFFECYWDQASENPAKLKELQATVRCLPFGKQDGPEGPSLLSGVPTRHRAILAKAY